MSVTAPRPSPIPGEPALSIRRAWGNDAPAVAELCARETPGAQPDPAFQSYVWAWLEAEGERRLTFVADAAGRPCGMISMLEYREMPRIGASPSRWAYIDHLFVVDERRQRGVGSALISRLTAIADERDYPKLLVAPTSASLSLFHRLGFLMVDELGPEGILLSRPRRMRSGA